MPQPFIKFYFADWEGDAQLMSCSLAAQGLWLRMMRVMHEAEPYGFFVGRAGEPIDVVAFSKRLGSAPRQIRALVAELEEAHVFARDPQDRIYSRRMVRDFARSQQMSEFGKRGGSPKLIPELKPNGLSQRVKPGHNFSRDLTPEAQIPRFTDSLRSSALEFREWPQPVEDLRRLALIFVAEFANCRDAIRAEKHVGPYTGVLATMRARGISIANAWQACVDARDACGGKPLWGAAIKSAISFLPARSIATAAKPVHRTIDPKELGID